MYREAGDRVTEKILTRAIRNSAKHNRSIWLENLASSGKWEDLRMLKKKFPKKLAKLKDESGNDRFSNERADTFAKYLESIQ